MRIIIVDDDPLFTNLSAAVLDRAGFDVQVARDGVEGLERIDAENFDLAIVDLHMPRVDGLRLIALLRGSLRHRRLAVLVVSGRTDADVFREAMQIGADAIEAKPLNWDRLPDRVRAIVEAKRAAQAA
ncbi:MAG: response regulator [Hyphomicrobiaceae bacterium]